MHIILFSNEGDDDDENHDDHGVQQFSIKSSRGCVYLTRKVFMKSFTALMDVVKFRVDKIYDTFRYAYFNIKLKHGIVILFIYILSQLSRKGGIKLKKKNVKKYKRYDIVTESYTKLNGRRIKCTLRSALTQI